MPVNEQIVGRCGALMSAPTCVVVLAAITSDIAGVEFEPGRRFEEGIAHTSLDVSRAVFSRTLLHRSDDDNEVRQAFLAAVNDWCWGGDLQWLYDAGDEHRMFSHDHGHFFPSGPNWTAESLRESVDTPHTLRTIGEISPRARGSAAQQLGGVTRARL